MLCVFMGQFDGVKLFVGVVFGCVVVFDIMLVGFVVCGWMGIDLQMFFGVGIVL